jgi:hypothetical protein
MTPLRGFSPDSEPRTAGVMTQCENIIPYESGFECAPSLQIPQGGSPVLPATCTGAGVTINLSAERRLFAGTLTNLYELIGQNWTTRGSGYTGGSDSRWKFESIGNDAVAVNGVDLIQRSTGAGFTTIPNSPVTKIILTSNNFLLGFNINHGGQNAPDGWICCNKFADGSPDITNWTPNIATQGNKGRIISPGGEITNAIPLGDYIAIYKRTEIWIGRNVGGAEVFNYQKIEGGTAGCVGVDAAVDIGGAHFVVGSDNFWIFDGTRPYAIADRQVRQWFFNTASNAFLYKTKTVFDRKNNRVVVYYDANNDGLTESALVYHLVKKEWGRLSENVVTSAIQYTQPTFAYDDYPTTPAYDGYSDIPYDSPYWTAGASLPAVIDNSNRIKVYEGESVGGSFTTNDFGDDQAMTYLTRLRMRYTAAPTTSTTCQVFKKQVSGSGWTAGVSGYLNDGKFDAIQCARWHKAMFAFNGNARIVSYDVDVKPAGQR